MGIDRIKAIMYFNCIDSVGNILETLNLGDLPLRDRRVKIVSALKELHYSQRGRQPRTCALSPEAGPTRV